MSISLKHIKEKMNKIFALYVCMLCTVRNCNHSKKSRHFARPLAKVIANELDELSMYFQYY